MSQLALTTGTVAGVIGDHRHNFEDIYRDVTSHANQVSLAEQLRENLLATENTSSATQIAVEKTAGAGTLTTEKVGAAINLAIEKVGAATALASVVGFKDARLDAANNTAAIQAAIAACCCEQKMLTIEQASQTRDLISSIQSTNLAVQLTDAKTEILALRLAAKPL